jgi:hypothetical protein
MYTNITGSLHIEFMSMSMSVHDDEDEDEHGHGHELICIKVHVND